MLDQAKLKRLFRYEPETGNFVRLVAVSSCRAGSIAGTIHPKGYVQIQIEGRLYKAHRLAWLYMTGGWPASLIDHRDLCPANNAWGNLREATRSQNGANKGKNSNNKSGFKGVHYDAQKGKWVAQIQTPGRKQYLGCFPTAELAHAAYAAAAVEAFGQFARAS
jgi:hypothetical protein